MKRLHFISLCFIMASSVNVFQANAQRKIIDLNGTWQFDQTSSAFPPTTFTRTIPVPGLIHLAEPKVEDYDVLFIKPQKSEFVQQHNLNNLAYKPKYSWYKRKFMVGKELLGYEALLTVKKSQYVTQVFINGMDAGRSISCFTPIELPVSRFLHFGEENEIIIRVGERVWLPGEAAGGTDKEKVNYFPGIWDDVLVSFTKKIRTEHALLLPSLKTGSVIAKLQLRNFYPAQIFYADKMYDTCRIEIAIAEKKTGKHITTVGQKVIVKRDNLTQTEINIPLPNAHLWSPNDPFLYTASVKVFDKDSLSDEYVYRFGMREFSKDGKFFTLNGEKIILRGTNITLHRFFEDPECQALPWDRTWVKTLLIDIPSKTHWNAMRICVGLVPDFWYDIADENGLMLQNEWLYWQKHGWDEQVKKEYTDWVWSDGNHPSIVIWDGINENKDAYIGGELIPELKKLDPTRLWDAGYMRREDGGYDDLDEPHPYIDAAWQTGDILKRRKDNPLPLGKLNADIENWDKVFEANVPQLVNEYGWIWLWRNGLPAKLTVPNYDYYVGKNATPEQNFEFQAYSMQMQTEWLRGKRSLAGILHFCSLTNNYGFTGDAFMGPIAGLTPSPMLRWFRHCFAPEAVFINLTDERYNKEPLPHLPGSSVDFELWGVNDLKTNSNGTVTVELLDETGKKVWSDKKTIDIQGFARTILPCTLKLPAKAGGYLLLARFVNAANNKSTPIISRRYIKVGKEKDIFRFFDLKPD